MITLPRATTYAGKVTAIFDLFITQHVVSVPCVFHQLLAVGRWFPPGTPLSTRKLISSLSFHCLDMTLAVAETLNPNKLKTSRPTEVYPWFLLVATLRNGSICHYAALDSSCCCCSLCELCVTGLDSQQAVQSHMTESPSQIQMSD